MTFSVIIAWILFILIPMWVALVLWAVTKNPYYKLTSPFFVGIFIWMGAGWYLFG